MTQQQFKKRQAENKIQEALLEYVAACHVENILLEYPPEIKEDPESVLPQEFNKRMKKSIKKLNKSQRRKGFKNKTISYMPRIAIALLVIFGSLTITVSSVEAFRIKALNIVLNIQEQYTSFRDADNSLEETTKLPLEWEGYVPAYIPPGFEINSYEDYKTAKSIYYSNGQGQTIRFTQYKSNDIDLWLDTEKAATENIMLNATEAFLIDKDGLISIVWAEDVTFCILGEGSKEELIKMAKSVNKKKFL